VLLRETGDALDGKDMKAREMTLRIRQR